MVSGRHHISHNRIVRCSFLTLDSASYCAL